MRRGRLAPDAISLCHNLRQVFDLLAEIVKRLDEVVVVLLRLLCGDLYVLRDLPDQTLRFTLVFKNGVGEELELLIPQIIPR